MLLSKGRGSYSISRANPPSSRAVNPLGLRWRPIGCPHQRTEQACYTENHGGGTESHGVINEVLRVTPCLLCVTLCSIKHLAVIFKHDIVLRLIQQQRYVFRDWRIEFKVNLAIQPAPCYNNRSGLIPTHACHLDLSSLKSKR